MTKYKHILFDLDGTISDSAHGIVDSAIHALNAMGIPPGDRDDLKKFIGPPLSESFSMYYNLEGDDLVTAMMHFREYYESKGVFENAMYEGIEQLLTALRERGVNLAIATSKPEFFARQILDRYGIAKYFSYIAGSNIDESGSNKDEVVAYALSSLKIPDGEKESVLMVGDRRHDVAGAAKNDIDCVGVLYGYGSKEELEKAGAKYIVRDIDELKALLCGN